MAVKPLWNSPPQFEDANGDPYSGAFLFFYAAGSSTKQNTYTDDSGGTACPNPITLNSSGYATVSGTILAPWGTVGQTYKIGLAAPGSADPPASFIWTSDDVAPINDVSTTTDQWVAGTTPTYISATSFSLVGDQTSTYHLGRRLKTTNTGGTIYSTITATAYGSVTTVTVVNDSGTLDSGLSAVSYGLISATNPSIDADMVNRKGTAIASAATTNIWAIAGDFVHVTGSTGPITSLGTAPYAGVERTVIFDSTPTLTHNATTLIIPGGANITAAAGDRMVVRADTTANMIVVSYIKASGLGILSTYTRQVFTSGSAATYTRPATCTAINVRARGPGGGGGAQLTNNGANGSGATTFSGGTMSAGAGVGGAAAGGAAGAGGAASGGDINIPGGGGKAGVPVAGLTGNFPGGAGGGAGGGVTNVNAVGGAGATNSGGGGSGGGATTGGGYSGSGGGEGGYCERLITSPSATYTYTIGTGGAAGAAGTIAGGAGADGYIIVDEFYG